MIGEADVGFSIHPPSVSASQRPGLVLLCIAVAVVANTNKGGQHKQTLLLRLGGLDGRRWPSPQLQSRGVVRVMLKILLEGGGRLRVLELRAGGQLSLALQKAGLVAG